MNWSEYAEKWLGHMILGATVIFLLVLVVIKLIVYIR